MLVLPILAASHVQAQTDQLAKGKADWFAMRTKTAEQELILPGLLAILQNCPRLELLWTGGGGRSSDRWQPVIDQIITRV